MNILFGLSAVKNVGKETIEAEQTVKLGKTKITTEGEVTDDRYLEECSKKLREGKKSSIFYAPENIKDAVKNQNEEITFTNQDDINEAMWKLADKDGDGYVDKDEYEALVKTTILGRKESFARDTKATLSGVEETEAYKEAYEEILKADEELDANGDGVYSRDEFNNSMLNHILTGSEAEEAEEENKEYEA